MGNMTGFNQACQELSDVQIQKDSWIVDCELMGRTKSGNNSWFGAHQRIWERSVSDLSAGLIPSTSASGDLDLIALTSKGIDSLSVYHKGKFIPLSFRIWGNTALSHCGCELSRDQPLLLCEQSTRGCRAALWVETGMKCGKPS